MANVFVVKPFAFDQPTVGKTFTDDGQELFAVFSYDDGEDESPYCDFVGTKLECNTQAREWNDKLARGERVVVSPSIRMF